MHFLQAGLAPLYTADNFQPTQPYPWKAFKANLQPNRNIRNSKYIYKTALPAKRFFFFNSVQLAFRFTCHNRAAPLFSVICQHLGTATEANSVSVCYLYFPLQILVTETCYTPGIGKPWHYSCDETANPIMPLVVKVLGKP